MNRALLFLACVFFAFGFVAAQDSALGEWSGAFTTSSGETGPLTATVTSPGADAYKVLLFATNQGVEFELTGKKEASKVSFSGTKDTDAGVFELQGDIIAGKMTGTFKNATYSGTFELSPVHKAVPVVGDWTGSFSVSSGMNGELAAKVTGDAATGYKAQVDVIGHGIQFEMNGRAEGTKALFTGTVTPSPEVGPVELKGEIVAGKFSGTITAPNFNGTFELTPKK